MLFDLGRFDEARLASVCSESQAAELAAGLGNRVETHRKLLQSALGQEVADVGPEAAAMLQMNRLVQDIVTEQGGYSMPNCYILHIMRKQKRHHL